MLKSIFYFLTLLALCTALPSYTSQETDQKTMAEPHQNVAQNAPDCATQPTPFQVYIDFLDMIVPMPRNKMVKYYKAKAKNQNGNRDVFILVHNSKLGISNVYEYMTDVQFKAYCEEQPEKITLVRFHNSLTPLSSKPLDRYEYVLYKRNKFEKNGQKECKRIKHRDGSVQYFTDVEYAAYKGSNKVSPTHQLNATE